MGQLVFIYSKDDKATEQLNIALKEKGIKNSFTTEQDNIDWLNDINKNPNAHQSHLKPNDRDLRMDELKGMFEMFTEINVLSFDVAFSRTTEDEANLYAEFIQENFGLIKSLKGADELISRYSLTIEQKKIIKAINAGYTEPEKLPKEEQQIPDLNGGVLLSVSWGKDPFWIIYGKVDKPTFLKEKIYVNDLYNNIYRDKKKHAYLLVPTIPANITMDELNKLASDIWNMGVREDIYYYMPILYSIEAPEGAYKSYAITYTLEEIHERFLERLKQSNFFSYGIGWNSFKNKFEAHSDKTSPLALSAMSILTNLLLAIVQLKGDKYGAELMTKTFGTKYIPSEFELK